MARGGGRISFLGGVPGLTFVRADKDDDGDYDPLTSTDWDGDAFAASTGTIDWNADFGVPALAKAVVLQVFIKDETVGASFNLRAKSTTVNASLNMYTYIANQYSLNQGVVPIAADGTSYYYIGSELDAVFIRVVGWYI